jgi:PBP1b-binding outer membrane lipoprotein LpoB
MRINPDNDDSLGGTGIDSADIRTVAQRMASSLMGVPQIAGAREKVRIALLPVRNRTRFRIDADIFTTKMRNMLVKYAGDKATFLQRARMEDIQNERAQKRNGGLEGAQKGNVLGADFFLTGELRALSKSSSKGQSDYVLYSFELIDAETSAVVWADEYEVKKQGKWGTVYQ